MKSGRRRRNIPPMRVDQSGSPQNTEALLQRRLNSAEKETGSLMEQLSTLGFVPEKIAVESDGAQRDTRRAPIAPYLAGEVDPHTLHKSYEALVTRVCKAESQIQTLKLNLCALQAEKDLYWTEAGDMRVQLKEETERALTNEQKWRLELEKVEGELGEVLQEKQVLEAELRKKEEALSRQDVDQRDVSQTISRGIFQSTVSAMLEEDKLTRMRLNRRVAELTKKLTHEVGLRQQLEDSHSTVLQRIQDMEDAVQRERKEMQRLVAVHTDVAGEKERLRQENRRLEEKQRTLEANIRELSKKLGIKDIRLREMEREKQTAGEKQDSTHQSNQSSLLARLKDLERESARWKQKSVDLEDALRNAKGEADKVKLRHGDATQALIRNSVEQDIAGRDQLDQQLMEAKMEIDALRRDKHTLEAERRRLEERIGTMEEQQLVHQKVETSITELMEGKNRLAYEKGQLQQRLEAMQKEVEGSARTRMENTHLIKATASLETQLKKKSDELSSAQLLVHQLRAQVRQEQNTCEMKERDFEMAIRARDGAVKEAESMNHRIEDMKHQEQIKVSGLQKSLSDAQADHSKMTSMMESVMSSHQNLQTTVESLQTEMGRKDREIAALKQERQNQESLLQHLKSDIAQRDQQLNGLKQGGIRRVESLQRELNTMKAENNSLSRALEDLSQANLQLQAALDGMQKELERLKQEKGQLQEDRERGEREASDQIDSLQEQLSSIQQQVTNQKSLVNKQTLRELATLRKTHTQLSSRFNDVSKANTELHRETVKLEGDLKKSQDRTRSLKAQIDGLRSLKDKNGELSKENESLKTSLADFREVKRAYVRKNGEQTETIAAFVEQVEQLQKEIGGTAVGEQSRRPTLPEGANRGEFETLEEENAALREKLGEMELQKSKLETELAEVSVESEEISAHIQDAHDWFQSKYTHLQNELVKANQGQTVLKEAVIEQARELNQEKLKSDKQTQKAYDIIRSSREALGRLAGQVERDHIESKSQMHFLARRVQAEKDHSTFVERKCNKLMDSSANCIEDLAIELDQTRTMLDTSR